MLDLAINYEEELRRQMNNIWFKEKYKFYNVTSYYDVFSVDDTSWNRHQFVSVATNGEVIGYIGYCINRDTNNCHSLGAINFSDNIMTFGIDLHRVLTDLFDRYKFRKLNFSVIVGNPIEKSYDKIVAKYGGRILGYYKDEVKLIDGDYYDQKVYEITREDYLIAKIK